MFSHILHNHFFKETIKYLETEIVHSGQTWFMKGAFKSHQLVIGPQAALLRINSF